MSKTHSEMIDEYLEQYPVKTVSEVALTLDQMRGAFRVLNKVGPNELSRKGAVVR